MGKRNNGGFVGTDYITSPVGVVTLPQQTAIRNIYKDNPILEDDVYGGPSVRDVIQNISNVGVSSSLYIGNTGSTGSLATAYLSGSLQVVNVVTGGASFTTFPTLSFSGGGGTGAAARVTSLSGGGIGTIQVVGSIVGVDIIDGGNYLTAPTLSFTAPTTSSGVPAVIPTASVTLDSAGAIASVTMVQTGSFYARGSGNYPVITLTGGTPRLSASLVPVMYFGAGYTSSPTVTVTGGGGSNAILEVVVGGPITSMSVDNGGSGFTTAPNVRVSNGQTSNTIFSASLSGNAVSTITVQQATQSYFHTNSPDPLVTYVGSLPDLPAIDGSVDKIVAWYAVYNNSSNFVAVQISGAYLVDWGDGTSGSFASNTTASKQYSTASYAALTSSVMDGFKPALISIVPSGSDRFVQVSFNTRPFPPTGSIQNGGANQFLDIRMAGSEINSLTVGYNGTGVHCAKLERFEFVGINKITNFTNAFTACYQLKQVPSLYTLSGSNFTSMFSTCYSLTDIPTLAVSGSLASMFSSCLSLRYVKLSPVRNVTSLSQTFAFMRVLQIVDGDRFDASVTNCNQTFIQAFSLLRHPEIDVSRVTDMASMYSSCYSLTRPYIKGSTAANTTFSATFNGCYSLKTLPPVFDCTSATTLATMFSTCRSLEVVPIFYNTGKVTTVSSMFSSSPRIKTIPLFYTGEVTTFASTFQTCTSVTSVPPFNTTKCTNFGNTFNGCSALTSGPLWILSNATTVSGMFNGCSTLRRVPLYDTRKVTTFSSMFASCTILLYCPPFNTENGTTFDSMFTSCGALKEGPPFNLSNATAVNLMFNACQGLQRVPAYDTANVTNMTSMFEGCISLKDAPTLNARRVTGGNMVNVYSNCPRMTRCGGFISASLVTSIANLFNGGTFLAEVTNGVQLSSSVATTTAFTSCVSLSNIRLNNLQNTFTVANGRLDATALNALYTSLATASGQTVTVTGNWGTAYHDPTIAQNKGWSVTA